MVHLRALCSKFKISGYSKNRKREEMVVHLLLERKKNIDVELSTHEDRFANASNVFPRMFDQPFTAALCTGQWEPNHTILNPAGGMESNIGLHHLAPPRTWSAAYKSRQEGEIRLTQQEQVRRQNNQTLLHGMHGYPPRPPQNDREFYAALMCVIIEFDKANPPLLLWLEVVKYTNILHSNEGRHWTALHRNIEEVIFNVGQEIQSTIAGFVSEARKTCYKTVLKMGATISSQIFDATQHQGSELRHNLKGTILIMQAGPYHEASIIFKLFQPDEPAKEANQRK